MGPVFDGDPIFPEKKVEFYGQPLFAVAATTTELARKAVLKAKITYKDLKPVVTIKEALRKKQFLFKPKKNKKRKSYKENKNIKKYFKRQFYNRKSRAFLFRRSSSFCYS